MLLTLSSATGLTRHLQTIQSLLCLHSGLADTGCTAEFVQGITTAGKPQ